MPLSPPNLDDRDFEQLLEESRRRIMQSCPEWTDLSPHDPGMVLLELFAHLTEIMIYRLNQLPEKAYIEFLRLMGVKILPPAAASVQLRFSLTSPQEQEVEIPKGTQVTVERSESATEPPIFTTASQVRIKAGQTETQVSAHHCELVEAELVGLGRGLPGLSVMARRPPIVAPLEDGLDLVVGVEVEPGEIFDRSKALQHDNKTYRIWREVSNFTELGGSDRFVYLADRMMGTVTFAPAIYRQTAEGQLENRREALAEIPPEGREIRLWYRRGGGTAGNVAANTLTVLKDVIAGLEVNNPEPATGGRPAETIENALIRGPQQLHSLNRAVTARDFELLALRSSGAVVRAKAFTKASLWTFARPGTVEVLLVPYMQEEIRDQEDAVTPEKLQKQETEKTRANIQKAIDECRPLGTLCLVHWVRYKAVRVKARVVVHPEERPIDVKARVLRRLYQTINPLPTEIQSSGWPFGQSLRASHVYDIILKEPGVRYADQVRLIDDKVPEENVRSLTADAFQPRTWYAATGQTLFRSLNDGGGWEQAGVFPDEAVNLVRVHPEKAGLLVVATELPGQNAESRLHVSWDCGETWEVVAKAAFSIEDMAWLTRGGVPILLLATDVGLYELAMQPGSSLIQVLVDPQDQDLGFYAVTVSIDFHGVVSVAVAALRTGGVFLSQEGGQPNTFQHTGLKGEDIRILEVQHDGPRSFLWAGLSAAGNEGKGCFSRELRSSATSAEKWKLFSDQWEGGSCHSLAFLGSKALAATHHAGVLWIDSTTRDPKWEVPEKATCGLPSRVDKRFPLYSVDAVAVDPEGQQILAGGPKGVYRSKGIGSKYEACSKREFVDKVTVPETWLFCSDKHEIEIVSEEDEAYRD